MTPLKMFVTCGSTIYTVDHHNNYYLIAVAVTADDARWIASAAANQHGVEFHIEDIRHELNAVNGVQESLDRR